MTENNFNLEISNLPIIEIYTCIQGEGFYMGVPHILIRTTGCPLRCQFGNSFCDTPYASWSPEKGSITFEDINKIYKENPQIRHTMITGGSPTLHAEFLRQLTLHIENNFEQIITIETEGSKFVADLSPSCVMSLSPKLKSSIPIPGSIRKVNEETTKEVTEQDKIQHEEYRCNYEAMNQLLNTYGGWLKPVINFDTFEQDVNEVNELQKILEVSNRDVYLMPAGMTDEQLNQCRKKLAEYCINHGYNYTDRLHVVIYGNLRGV